MGLTIALFPGLSTVQFLSLTVCKNGGGRSGRFSHVYDNRYTEGRHGGGAGGGEGCHTPRCKIRGRGRWGGEGEGHLIIVNHVLISLLNNKLYLWCLSNALVKNPWPNYYR